MVQNQQRILLKNTYYGDPRTIFTNEKQEYLVYAISVLSDIFKRIQYSENLYLKNVTSYDNKHLIKLLNIHI